MSAEKDIHQWIERYLDGLLEQKEKISFEQKLQTDTAFAQELELARKTRQLVTVAGRNHLRSRLEEYEKEVVQQTNSIYSFLKTWWIAIITVLTLGFALWWFASTNQKNKPAQIYAAQFEPYRNPLNLRSLAPVESNNWSQATEHYNQQDFEKSAVAFQKILSQNSEISYLAQFYLGVSLLAQKTADPQKAIVAFNAVLQSDNDYHQQALWYKALAYVQLEELENAKSIFEEIVENDFYKKEAAIAILKQME